MDEKRFKDLKLKVETILATQEKTRNSDITLMVALWKKYFPEYIEISRSGREMVDTAALYELPREDNIKRVRAQIQNVERRYLPTDMNVFLKRARLSDEWKQCLGYKVNWTSGDWANAIKEYLKPKQEGLF